MLDDSTDETSEIVARAVASATARAGVDIHHLHRTDRTGYKAGALDAGLAAAQRRAARHLRRRLRPARRTSCAAPSPTSPIARRRHGAGALGPPQPRRLAAHPGPGDPARRPLRDRAPARNRSGRFFNFNGTAGIWRRAGDRRRRRLAARHADRGPRPLLPRPARGLAVRLPARASWSPPSCRWTSSASRASSTAGPRARCRRRASCSAAVLRAPLPLRVKLEAFVHLTNNASYPLMVLLVAADLPGHAAAPRHLDRACCSWSTCRCSSRPPSRC